MTSVEIVPHLNSVSLLTARGLPARDMLEAVLKCDDVTYLHRFMAAEFLIPYAMGVMTQNVTSPRK